MADHTRVPGAGSKCYASAGAEDPHYGGWASCSTVGKGSSTVSETADGTAMHSSYLLVYTAPVLKFFFACVPCIWRDEADCRLRTIR